MMSMSMHDTSRHGTDSCAWPMSEPKNLVQRPQALFNGNAQDKLFPLPDIYGARRERSAKGTAPSNQILRHLEGPIDRTAKSRYPAELMRVNRPSSRVTVRKKRSDRPGSAMNMNFYNHRCARCAFRSRPSGGLASRNVHLRHRMHQPLGALLDHGHRLPVDHLLPRRKAVRQRRFARNRRLRIARQAEPPGMEQQA